VTGFPKPVRDLVHARSGGFCERCGEQPAVQIHHRRPRGMGGSSREDTNNAANALHLCVGCHQWIESNRAEAVEMGWLVRQESKPLHMPVLLRGEWVWLDDAGGTLRIAQIVAATPDLPPFM